MSRKKGKRFAFNETAENVIQTGKPFFENCKGLWQSNYFRNNNPIVLEIGCGKGEYTVGLASVFPEKNFIGIDIKGDRIAVGSKRAIEQGLKNVGFLRTNVLFLENFFEENEVSEIWVTFPDPRPLKGDIKLRLTSPRFITIYQKLLQSNGLFHLKTDNEPFFDYSLEELEKSGFVEIAWTKDLYTSELAPKNYQIKTRFEEIFTEKGFLINYLEAKWMKN